MSEGIENNDQMPEYDPLADTKTPEQEYLDRTPEVPKSDAEQQAERQTEKLKEEILRLQVEVARLTSDKKELVLENNGLRAANDELLWQLENKNKGNKGDRQIARMHGGERVTLNIGPKEKRKKIEDIDQLAKSEQTILALALIKDINRSRSFPELFNALRNAHRPMIWSSSPKGLGAFMIKTGPEEIISQIIDVTGRVKERLEELQRLEDSGKVVSYEDDQALKHEFDAIDGSDFLRRKVKELLNEEIFSQSRLSRIPVVQWIAKPFFQRF